MPGRLRGGIDRAVRSFWHDLACRLHHRAKHRRNFIIEYVGEERGASEMPVLAYFWKVGAALIALLFVADFCLPKAAVTGRTAVDQATIRIHSDRKWPERVVLDTTLPVIVAVTSAPVITEPAPLVSQMAPVVQAETPAVANALAMARSDLPPHEAVERKRPRKTQHVAMQSKRHGAPRMVLAARQPKFGWFGYRYW
nr:hypothetical protein CIT39_23450 [Bradyrhizobium symbiodeficiens]